MSTSSEKIAADKEPDVEQRLKKVLANILEMREDEITDETAMGNTRKWDSLGHIEIMFGIEDEFEIPPLSTDEIVEMTSFTKIKQVLREKGIKC